MKFRAVSSSSILAVCVVVVASTAVLALPRAGRHPDGTVTAETAGGRSKRAVGGVVPDRTEIPFLIRIEQSITISGTQYKLTVSGSLISARYVLTLANELVQWGSFIGYSNVALKLTGGDLYPSNVETGEQSTTVNAGQVRLHPSFDINNPNRDPSLYNMAIIDVGGEALFTDTLSPIQLDLTAANSATSGRSLRLGGWGYYTTPSYAPYQITLTGMQCDPAVYPILSAVICYSDVTDARTPCGQGDAGSPVYLSEVRPVKRQVGISLRSSCTPSTAVFPNLPRALNLGYAPHAAFICQYVPTAIGCPATG